MADITRYLEAIMAAVLGEEVRGSIHDAIDIINKVGEKQLNVGDAIHSGDPAGDAYLNSLYINTTQDRLLKCNGSIWIDMGTIRGNGIFAITGPVSDVLKDTYTIHYTDGVTTTFDVYNGKGIIEVRQTGTSGLVDTYTIFYNDNTSYEFNVKNGNQWNYGVLVSGKVAAGANFTLPFAVRSGDSYLNISEDAVYHCTTNAEAGNVSTWVYDFTITSSSTGTNDYQMLINRPSLNGHTITGAMESRDLDLDSYLVDGSTPPVVIEKPMAVGSMSISFTAAQMADVYTNGWSVRPQFHVADGYEPPKIRKMYVDGTTHDLVIEYTAVTANQAGGPSGTACKCRLRIIR